MALSPTTGRRTLQAGQRILVDGFTATVDSRSDYTGAVRVNDENGSNTHYISPARLSKGRPFTSGQVYSDANGDLFQYSSVSVSVFAEGTWLPYTLEDGADSSDELAYSFPVRPMREFTVNPVIAE